MRRSFLLLVAVTVTCSFTAEGARKMKMIRGGQGFLYPDHNSLANVGQVSRDKGTSLEVQYGRQDVSGTTTQSLTPSLSYTNGRLGLVVVGSRTGTAFDSDSSTDTVGGGLGFSLGRRRTVNLGVSYVTTLGTTPNIGVVQGVFNVNPSKGKGVSFGVGAGTTTGSTGTAPISGTVGLGYAGRNRNNNIEANLSFADINDTSAYTIGGFFTLGGRSYYLGGGYRYATAAGTTTNNVVGRLGVVFGRAGSVDMSAFINYPLETTTQPTYGASIRANF